MEPVPQFQDNLRSRFNLEPIKDVSTNYGDFELRGPVRLPLECPNGKIYPFVAYLFSFMPGNENNWILLYSEKHGIPQHETVLRIESACIWAHLLKSRYCDCDWQLDQAKQAIAEQGGLILFGLDQHGKGLGIKNHFEVYAKGQQKGEELVVDAYVNNGWKEDYRDYSRVADILRLLKIESVKIMTNNPKRLQFLRGQGFEVERAPHFRSVDDYLEQEYQAKKTKLSHEIRFYNEGDL